MKWKFLHPVFLWIFLLSMHLRADAQPYQSLFGHGDYPTTWTPTNPDSASMHLYWTLGKTGEVWDRNWIGNNTLPGTTLPAGGEITPPSGIPIPSINPGADLILTKDWLPPKPQDFDTSGILDRIDVCALARIETMQPGMGMVVNTSNFNILLNHRQIIQAHYQSRKDIGLS